LLGVETAQFKLRSPIVTSPNYGRASIRNREDRIRASAVAQTPPYGAQGSGVSFLFFGIYYHETHRTRAKTDRNMRATTPKKTPNTTGSNLRFGLNVEPKESFASSGRSGS